MLFRLEEEIQFGCELADIPCMFMESQARTFSKFLVWFADITLGQQDLAPGTKLWNTAIAEVGYWMPFAILVMIATASIGIWKAGLKMSPRELAWTAVWTVLAIPSTLLALTVGGELLKVTDEISNGIMKRLGGNDGFANLVTAAVRGGTGSDEVGMVTQLTGMQGAGTFIMLGLMCIGMFLMAAAIAFRNFAVMILIAFSPLAFMAIPMKGGDGITRKWAAAGIAMVIAKPLMLGVLAMVMRGMKDIALFSPETLTLGIGLIVVTFMPFMAYSFFNFIGAARAGDAGDHVGGAFGNKMGNAARSAGRTAQGVAGKAGAAGRGGGAGARAKRSAASSSKSDSSSSSSKKPGASPAGGQSSDPQQKNSNGSGGGKDSGSSKKSGPGNGSSPRERRSGDVPEPKQRQRASAGSQPSSHRPKW